MNRETLSRDPYILLVEDNPVDVLVTRKALEEGGFRFRLHVIEDGQQALDFLHEHCNSTDINSFCPAIILLDLNLPRISGKEILADIREHPSTSFIPVIILTTSASDEDVVECYSQSANCYITKPVSVDDFKKAILGIGTFWTEIAKLPKILN
jgi:chemotaxis family two-component system response regulator Rcp1